MGIIKSNKKGLVGDVVIGSCLRHSDHEITEFSILGEVRKGTLRISTMDFQWADFDLFRRLTESLGSQS